MLSFSFKPFHLRSAHCSGRSPPSPPTKTASHRNKATKKKPVTKTKKAVPPSNAGKQTPWAANGHPRARRWRRTQTVRMAVLCILPSAVRECVRACARVLFLRCVRYITRSRFSLLFVFASATFPPNFGVAVGLSESFNPLLLGPTGRNGRNGTRMAFRSLGISIG